ncbi:hypothetical protein QUB80_00485 [Chlorogloeopsis sp. ULAP01]|uniref:hypothetical protein n=1 Tax=Chlorogloeopsis sp. ULAP01 TaxID=3056483 RepID=UPI0025AABE15|nr:hypothetical protein [Chlorogloeopsis sp. ULAP01]MDM9379185.1 hypothetical protein [Chlorogloeopsis sp. ULAP01]
MRNNEMCIQTEDTKLQLNSGYDSTSFLWRFMSNFWQKIVNLLQKHQELQVYQKNDHKGNTYWQAYDPLTGKSFTSGSESDVRAWIEQLYR